MEIRELYSNEGYWTTKIQMDLYRSLIGYMEKQKLSRTQLARKLGVTKGYISQILNGDFNHKLSKLVEISLAIGLVPDISFKKLEELIIRSENNFRTVSWEIEVNNDPVDIPILIDKNSQPLENVG
jgi:transcriptional regulator with XRE-family HTH domain